MQMHFETLGRRLAVLERTTEPHRKRCAHNGLGKKCVGIVHVLRSLATGLAVQGLLRVAGP